MNLATGITLKQLNSSLPSRLVGWRNESSCLNCKYARHRPVSHRASSTILLPVNQIHILPQSQLQDDIHQRQAEHRIETN